MLSFILLTVASVFMRVGVGMGMRITFIICLKLHHLLCWLSLRILLMSLSMRILTVWVSARMSVFLIVFFVIFLFSIVFGQFRLILGILVHIFAFTSTFHFSLTYMRQLIRTTLIMHKITIWGSRIHSLYLSGLTIDKALLDITIIFHLGLTWVSNTSMHLRSPYH
jgi:hypothetical protein